MDIADWLKGLGLAQYAAAFRENDITEALLPKLTGEDLKDLGHARYQVVIALVNTASRSSRICSKS